ncbi:MAG TPA: hypothetical protein VMT85_25465 [Thermoanaerobaculia bacterium]|nr:hypothetical protein [Thermoanaerobaculia bacterium]
MKTRPFAAAAAAVAALALAAPAIADFKASFREGVKAYDQQNWSEVARYMLEALQDRPHSDRVSVAIFSTKRITYIPNTFLGIALYHLDRCEEAMSYFESAETQGIASSREREYFSEMVEARRRCTDKLMEQTIASAGAAMQKASMMAANVDQMKKDPAAAAIMGQSPEMKARLDRGMEYMEGAQQRLQAGTQARKFEIVRDAAEFAKKAEAELTDLEKAMKEKLSAGAGEALQAAQQGLAAARTAAQELERYRSSADVGAVWSRNAALGRLESEADELLASAARGLDSAGSDVTKIEKASKDADQARAKFEDAQNQARQRVAQERRRRESAEQIAAGARSSIAGAQRALEALDRFRGAAPLEGAWARGGRLGSRESELSATLAEAREALAEGDRRDDPDRLGRAADLADQAAAGFRALAGEAETLLAAADRPDPGPVVTPSGEATPGDEPATRLVPPPALRNAVAAYFAGDYQETVDLLQEEAFEEPRATAQASLFRAAARFALWQLGGREDEQLRAAIGRDISTGKASDPDLRAEPRFFPPPFVELVRDGE